MEQNAKYTRFIANKISMHDAVIKQQIYQSFGVINEGLCLICYAMSMNSNSREMERTTEIIKYSTYSQNEPDEYQSRLTIKYNRINITFERLKIFFKYLAPSFGLYYILDVFHIRMLIIE